MGLDARLALYGVVGGGLGRKVAQRGSLPVTLSSALANTSASARQGSGHVHGRGVLSRAVAGLEEVLAERRPPCDPY
jgi:hypothetical protein